MCLQLFSGFSSCSFTDTQIALIAGKLSRFRKLEDINLSNNLITEAGITAILEHFLYTPKIGIFNLANNRISSIGASNMAKFQARRFTVLDLSGNIFTEEQKRQLRTKLSSRVYRLAV